MTHRKSAAVLISGGGSNLQALIDASQETESPYEISMVVSNQDHAGGLDRARRAGIQGVCVSHTEFSRREDYDLALLETLAKQAPDLVFLSRIHAHSDASFCR